ncbi:MAG: ABC transporter permease [Cyclobacteriaceae bacterium]
MIRNYLNIALRFFMKQRAYSLINILGLAIGIACSLFILLWVEDELKMDRFHEKEGRLFKAMRHAYFTDGNIFTWSAIPKPLAQTLEEEYPEVEEAELQTWQQQLLIAHHEQSYKEEGFFAGEDFFKIFSFPFIEGDPTTALKDIHSVAISEKLANKLFGNGPALGQMLRVDNRAEFKVTGVFSNPPASSSLQFDFVLPIEEFIQRNDWVEDWGNNGLRMHVLLKENASHEVLNAKLKDIIREHDESSDADAFLKPFEEVYLYGDYEEGKLQGGRITYVKIFSLIAFFILLIACINFTNLATARASRRAREVGMRKAVGASRRSLFVQFMAESFLIVLLATLLALLLVWLLMPYFNTLTGKNIPLDLLNPDILLLLLGVLLLTTLMAGSYPAVYMASLNTMKILRGNLRSGKAAANFRRSLVVFQFAISLLLIVGTSVIYRQLQYIQNKSLGMDRENLLYMYLEGDLQDKYAVFKEELLQSTGIQSISAASQNPLSVGNSTTGLSWEGKAPDEQILFSIINADYDFLQTMGMELSAGRDFSREFSTDTMNIIINEEAARAMGMEEAVGQHIKLWDEYEGEIIGVVKDFHFASLRSEIGPLFIRLRPDNTSFAFVRTQPGQLASALAALESSSQQLNPAFPFEYHFLDQDFEEIYQSEQTIGKLAGIFALVTIIISCLGLLGLASYTAEQRIREISVRKVLGASEARLVMLMSGEFSKLVLIAFGLGAPLAYFLMQQWLEAFAYRVSLSWLVFVVAGLIALVTAWLTVAYQSFKAAHCNPAEVLRSE